MVSTFLRKYFLIFLVLGLGLLGPGPPRRKDPDLQLEQSRKKRNAGGRRKSQTVILTMLPIPTTVFLKVKIGEFILIGVFCFPHQTTSLFFLFVSFKYLLGLNYQKNLPLTFCLTKHPRPPFLENLVPVKFEEL